jgi:spermidine synthase
VKNKSEPQVAAGMPVSLRRFLYISASITGGAIMIIEILGAKMLAPFVGTSHFVWTAQIAVTLVALAVGYYAGGQWVDKRPQLRRMYLAILAAAVYLALTVVMVQPVAYACLGFPLAAGSLLASAFLFFVPLALLAMVGPFFIRVLTVSMTDVGGNIGRLSAMSTFGSFVGTILIGYVLIPFLPNSITMYLTAVILAALAGAYFLVWERRGLALGAATVALFALVGYGTVRQQRPHFAEVRELYRANSNFGLVQVVENQRGDRRFYLNDYLVQNIYDPQSKKSLALFTYALHDLATAYTHHIDRALCIGLGVGIVPNEFAQEGVQMDVVEINPAVVPVAARLFNCQTNLLHLFIGDGRYFINECTNQYDTVIVDAFLGDSSPSHLMTRQAFNSIKRILKPDGVLVMNSFGDFQTDKDFMTASLDKTLRRVFPSVRIHASGNGNVFFVASPRAELEMLRHPDLDRIHVACRSDAMAAFNGIVHADPDHGIVLTDDYNPVEFYDAATREEHRRRLAMHMKSL